MTFSATLGTLLLLGWERVGVDFSVGFTLEYVCFITSSLLITPRAVYGDMSANTEALYEIAAVMQGTAEEFVRSVKYCGKGPIWRSVFGDFEAAGERNAIKENLPGMISIPLGKITKHLNILTIHWSDQESTLGGWSTVIYVESFVKWTLEQNKPANPFSLILWQVNRTIFWWFSLGRAPPVNSMSLANMWSSMKQYLTVPTEKGTSTSIIFALIYFCFVSFLRLIPGWWMRVPLQHCLKWSSLFLKWNSLRNKWVSLDFVC